MQSMLNRSEALRFETNGYLGPYSLPKDVLKPWRKELLPAIGTRIDEQHGFVRRNQHLYSKSLVDLVTADPIIDRVKALLGTETILLWTAHVIERAPHSPGQNWHVDRINMLTRSLHVTIALTDMTVANGCLRAIPHSHLYRLELSSQRNLSGDTDVSALADSCAPWHAPHSVENLEIKAGQFFFTWGGLWHSVGTNSTNNSRFACVARFGRPDIRIRSYGFEDEIQGPLVPSVLVSGSDEFRLNDNWPYPERDFFTDPGYNPRPSIILRLKNKIRSL